MKEFFLEERGIYYRTNDFKEGRKTLVFVHGLSGSSSAWKPYEELYKDIYNVVTYDLRGHGKSKRFSDYKDYAVPEFTEDLKFLLRKLSIEKFVLISHSFGVLPAIDFLLKYPAQVERAVFLSPNFDIGGYWLLPFLYLGIALNKTFGAMLPLKPRMSHVNYEGYIGTGDWNIRRTYADVRNTGFLEYLYATKQTLGFNYMDKLNTITVPVLLMHGKRDTIFRYTNSLRIRKEIPHAELIILPQADHILVLNYFKEVSTAISTFVENHA